MRLPKPALSTWMAWIVLIAVDFGILRKFPQNDQAFLLLFALPAVNILTLVAIYDRHRRLLGGRSPSRFGFQVGGWIGVVVYLVPIQFWWQSIGFALSSTFEPIRRRTMDNLPFELMHRLDPSSALTWKLATTVMALSSSLLITSLILSPAWVAMWIAGRCTKHHQVPCPPGIADPVDAKVS